MEQFLENLCGVDTFVIRSGNEIGFCFQYLSLVIPAHFFLATASSFYMSRLSGQRIIRNLTQSKLLALRCAVSALTTVLPLAYLLLSTLWLKSKPAPITIAAITVLVISWSIHTLYLFKLRYMHVLYIRCHLPVLASWALTAVTTVVQAYSVVTEMIVQDRKREKGSALGQLLHYSILTFVLLQLGYLLTLLTPTPKRIREISEESGLLSGQQHLYDTFQSGPATSLGTAEDEANCLSRLFFWWVQPLMIKGSKGALRSSEDLFDLPRAVRTETVEKKFSISGERQTREDTAQWLGPAPPPTPPPLSPSTQYSLNADSEDQLLPGDPKPSQTGRHLRAPSFDLGSSPLTLIQAFHRAFGLRYYLLGLLKLVSDLLGFAGPILLNYLVKFMEERKEPMFHGYLYAAGLFLSTLLVALLSNQFNYLVFKVSLQMRAALVTTIYAKTLEVSSVTLSKFTTGQIVNFMSTDVDRIRNFANSFHQFWSLPVQIAVALYLLYQQVHISFLAGVGLMVLLIPINHYLAVRIGKLNQEMMKHKDSRVKLINEILFGIRVIKFFNWEQCFAHKIDQHRQQELKMLRGIKYLDAFCVYFWATTPVLISILTFATYVALDNRLTAAKVFTSMALFNMLITPLNAFPWVLNGMMEAWISVKRIQAFLQMPNQDLNSYYLQDVSDDYRLVIKSGTFKWQQPGQKVTKDQSETQPLLEENSEPEKTQLLTNVNFKVKKGQLVGVVGAVGSGKSSLLAAILAEMSRAGGTVGVADLGRGFGLVAQEAWIQRATLRDNILFGRPYHHLKYQKVIEACALTEDLKTLPAADLTEIGENGVTLSGGQKARVALARAVYQDKDLYLLDDPLAAVDAHVASYLFQHCILGILSDKTRILCTHHLQFLQSADFIVLMQSGQQVKCGSPSEILDSDLPLLNFGLNLEPSSSKLPDENKKVEEAEATVVQEEEKEVGVVRLHVYKSYWKAVGSALALAILLALFLMQASKNVNDWWLSYWVTQSSANTSTTTFNDLAFPPTIHLIIHNVSFQRDFASSPFADKDSIAYYLTIYAILAASNTIFTFFRAFLFAYGGLVAAKKIHKKLLSSILKAAVSFFDSNPIGRIINRFSSDMYEIDDSLPFVLNILLAQLYALLGTLAITCYGLPWFTLVLLPLAVLYYYIQRYYRLTSRELKRIGSITLSPIYSHFTETLTGLATIRALRETIRFKLENREKLERSQKAFFADQAAAQWLGIRLQMLAVAMVTCVAFIAVLEHHYQSVNPGLVGLAITYALSVTGLLSGVLTYFTQTEKEMVSVERAVEYSEDIRYESPDQFVEAPPEWPSRGQVVFEELYLAYRPGLQNALDGVSFGVDGGEKVGIVGRTGSGKSSLFLSLFRMVNFQQGRIKIDDFDISLLSLHQLRSRLAIIPQDSFLYSGSIRDNLDPRGAYPDHDLWSVLVKCHLGEVVEQMGGLEAEVLEKGKLFSVGQKQLLCLARAMLTRAKILCIDEATASVDYQTDRLIQDTIRQEFANNTVLTIAHRINTILDSDRVLVMDSGRVLEFDKPTVLLKNHDSVFYNLVNRGQLSK